MAKNMTNEIVVERLSNDALIVSKDMPFLRTITFGMGVNVGAANETPGNSGISHLIEHSVFKGTKNFSGRDLKRVIESVGGVLNAFTSREYTLFYAKVPDFASRQAFDVLYELVSAPTFPEKEIELEKGVVLEEIAMYEDDPADLSGTNLLKALWGEETPYGRPIIGKAETVKDITIGDIKKYFKEHYVSSNIVLSIVGNLKSCDMSYIKEKMGALRDGKSEGKIAKPVALPPRNVLIEKRDLKQVNVSIGIKTVEKSDKRSYPLAIITTILGGGMSSVLFERLREKYGLVYSISSSNQSNKLGGYFTVDFSTSPNRVFEAIKKIKKVLSDMVDTSSLKKHMDYGKKRLKGKLLTSTESTFSTMFMMIDDQFTLRKVREIDTVIRSIESVRYNDVAETFKDFFLGKWTLSAVGPPGTVLNELKAYEFEVNGDGH